MASPESKLLVGKAILAALQSGVREPSPAELEAALREAAPTARAAVARARKTGQKWRSA